MKFIFPLLFPTYLFPNVSRVLIEYYRKTLSITI